MNRSRRTFALALTISSCCLLGSCERGPERARCTRCGMHLGERTGFEAWLGGSAYDTPKCLFRDLTEGSLGTQRAEVTEYYSGKRMGVAEADYVVGSDVLGPMGPDLVPVAPERAESFAREHGGRVLSADAIDAQVLEAL